ncbi:MAG: 50S ribosomal protein L35 [bacterium]
MPKLKTHKATAKRFKITKNKKVKKKTGGQGHFNSRETGNTTRNKRRETDMSKTHTKTIKKALPYS